MKIEMGAEILKLVRTMKFGTGARGVFYLPDGSSVHTLENDPIPAGTYFMRPDITGKHKHWVIESELESRTAAGRTNVEIHAGNRLRDSEACILPGVRTVALGVSLSVAALNKMREDLRRNTENSPTWILEITEAF